MSPEQDNSDPERALISLAALLQTKLPGRRLAKVDTEALLRLVEQRRALRITYGQGEPKVEESEDI